jgi:glycosyltransferase involved in cell wall biosynthesis
MAGSRLPLLKVFLSGASVLLYAMKVVRANHPESVHVLSTDHFVFATALIVIGERFRRGAIPWKLVLSFHIPGVCEPRQWPGALRKALALMNLLSLHLLRIAKRDVRVVVYSDAASELLRKRGIRSIRVCYPLPWVPDQVGHSAGEVRNARKLLGLPEDIPLLLVFGTVAPEKRLDVLLKALSLVRTELRVLIAGFLRSGYTLPAEVDQVRDKLILRLNRIPEEEVAAYYTAADVVVVLNDPQYYRGVGAASGVSIQAITSGKVVIMSEGGALSEWVTRHRLGVTVPSGDASSLARAICEILHDLNGHLANARQGAAVCGRYFSWEETTRGAYGELLEHDTNQSRIPP